MAKIMHFWTSKKARRREEDSPFRPMMLNWNGRATEMPAYRTFAMIKGRVVRYDFCTPKKRHNCGWDDMVYIGGGVWHHAERVD